MLLIYEFRHHSTIFRTEVSSRIHFWGLEGPEMFWKIKPAFFNRKVHFREVGPDPNRTARTTRLPPPPSATSTAHPRPNYRPGLWPGHGNGLKIGHLRKILRCLAELVSAYHNYSAYKHSCKLSKSAYKPCKHAYKLVKPNILDKLAC